MLEALGSISITSPLPQKNKEFLKSDCRCGSMIEHLPTMREALVLMPSQEKLNNQN
jgi:hypothetical protein